MDTLEKIDYIEEGTDDIKEYWQKFDFSLG